MDSQTLQIINEHMSGKYTQWDSFGVYFLACVLIGIMVLVLVKSIFDATINKKETPESFEGRIQKLFTRVNPHIGAILAVVGILAMIFGAYLILKI